MKELITPWDIAVTMDEWKKAARENDLEVDDPERNVFFAKRMNELAAERLSGDGDWTWEDGDEFLQQVRSEGLVEG